MQIKTITTADVEKMTRDELLLQLNDWNVRSRIGEEFFSDEERQELYKIEKEFKQLAENNGISVREMNHLDHKSTKSFIVICAVSECNLKFYSGKNFEELFKLFAKCSRKKCQNQATHIVYRLSGVGKGSWKTTVKSKQYCEKCLNSIIKKES